MINFCLGSLEMSENDVEVRPNLFHNFLVHLHNLMCSIKNNFCGGAFFSCHLQKCVCFETAFSQITLAFRCDQYTLKQRLQAEEHARNLAEENVQLELARGRETLEVLSLCGNHIKQGCPTFSPKMKMSRNYLVTLIMF